MKTIIAGTIILACLLLMIAGCRDDYSDISFSKVESERTKLIGGIESYQRIDEFENLLGNKSSWEVSKESPPSPKGRPPFNMTTIVTKQYTHLGYTGSLEVSFFNNRLISTTFYPSDADKYVEALVKVEGLRFNDSHEASLPPYTRVKFETDYKGRKYVDWADVRLDTEVGVWIKRYS